MIDWARSNGRKLDKPSSHDYRGLIEALKAIVTVVVTALLILLGALLMT
jgi:hypothetical protein